MKMKKPIFKSVSVILCTLFILLLIPIIPSQTSQALTSTIPSTPTGVTAASSSFNSINISWSGVTGATGYEIYRATSSAGTYTLISSPSAITYKNIGLKTNSIYYYKVKSYRMVGTVKVYSGFSTTTSAKPIPATPINIKASQISSNSIKLTWSGVSGANGYEVYRATSSIGAYNLLTRLTYLYYTNSGLIAGKTYYYKIRAYQTVGTTIIYSNWSAVVCNNGVPGWTEVITGANSQNNISNENFTVKQGDWIYYYALRENALYKVKVDGTNKTKILNANILSMVVKDNFIYYINAGDNATIYRVGTDGSGCKSLNNAYVPNTDCSSLNISGNWLCYIDFRMNSMAMLSLDGSQFKQIHNHAFMPIYLYVWGDEVYGVNGRTDHSIYKVNLGEADGTVINSDESGYVNLSNGDVFYSNRSDGEKLYKITSSGTRVKLNDDKSWWINVFGDWVYYSNANDGNKLYKVRKDGSGRTQLNNEFTCHINIIGQWIFTLQWMLTI
jgi:fibronectin type 3 domain-containing protein